MLVDSHCHIDLMLEQNPNDTAEAILARAAAQDVSYILNVCTALKTFNRSLKVANAFQTVATSVGSHPNERDDVDTVQQLLQLGANPKVVAIGETGLDYYRSEGDCEWQRERFRRHIAAAKTLKKPLIIHTRMAREDTITIMQEEDAKSCGGVMHCFSEDWATAKAALEMGFYISFSGVVTFKNATEVKEVASKVPLDRMLIETDSPYLAPVPYRGKANEPGYVKYTALFLAELQQVSYEDFAAQTTHNFFQLFDRKAFTFIGSATHV